MSDKILGIELMGERKYWDFLLKSPHFLPQIKLLHFYPESFTEKSKSVNRMSKINIKIEI